MSRKARERRRLAKVAFMQELHDSKVRKEEKEEKPAPKKRGRPPKKKDEKK